MRKTPCVNIRLHLSKLSGMKIENYNYYLIVFSANFAGQLKCCSENIIRRKVYWVAPDHTYRITATCSKSV